MREILFRGRGCAGWVYGDLFSHSGRPAIKSRDDGLNYAVDPETLGECTGLTDKGGNWIFEGDIIQFKDENNTYRGEVRFGKYLNPFGSGGGGHQGFYVEWGTERGSTMLRCDLVFWAQYDEAEIAGNIFDNPELLEGRS